MIVFDCFVAASDDIRAAFADQRLQRLATEIDGASDREAALITALEDENFVEFANKVRIVLKEEEAHGGLTKAEKLQILSTTLR